MQDIEEPLARIRSASAAIERNGATMDDLTTEIEEARRLRKERESLVASEEIDP